jgi:hypothetical protein
MPGSVSTSAGSPTFLVTFQSRHQLEHNVGHDLRSYEQIDVLI